MEANRAIETAAMSREEWLDARRKGIGGSDAPAIMGASPWATPLTVYADKMGAAPEKEETVAMRFGRDAEEIVARWFAQDTGKKVRRVNAILQHPQHPWMLANIDRKIQSESAGLECKTTSAFNRTDFEGGHIPPYYYWQCVHYMAVTGFQRWYLAGIHGNDGFYHYEIPRNEAHSNMLITREEDFWRNNVLAECPPMPTGSDGDERVFANLYDEQEDTPADLTGCENLLDELALAKVAQKAYEKTITQIEQQLKMRMADAQRGQCGRWKLTYASQSRATLDSKRLKAELPELYDQYRKISICRPLTIKEVKQ